MSRAKTLRGLLVGLALFGVGCGGSAQLEPQAEADVDPATDGTASAASTQTVESEDGLLVLSAREGADAIRVAIVEPNPAVVAAGVDVIATYELSPDGSTFDPAISVWFEVPEPVMGTSVMMLIDHGDGWTLEGEQSVDQSIDGTTIEASISEFSSIMFVKAPAGEPLVSEKDLGRLLVGETRTLNVRPLKCCDRIGSFSASLRDVEGPISWDFDLDHSYWVSPVPLAVTCEEPGRATFSVRARSEGTSTANVFGSDFFVGRLNGVAQATEVGFTIECHDPSVTGDLDLMSGLGVLCESPMIGSSSEPPCPAPLEVTSASAATTSCTDISSQRCQSYTFVLNTGDAVNGEGLFDPTAFWSEIGAEFSTGGAQTVCYARWYLQEQQAGCVTLDSSGGTVSPPLFVSGGALPQAVLQASAPLSIITCDQFRQGLGVPADDGIVLPDGVALSGGFPSAWANGDCPAPPSLDNVYVIWGPDPSQLDGTRFSFDPDAPIPDFSLPLEVHVGVE